MDFTGRTVLVTGAASGIGRATALRMAREGAAVVVADKRRQDGEAVVEEINAQGGEALFRYVELSDSESIREMAGQVARRSDALHGLVNNAGVWRPGTLEHKGDEHWKLIMGVNLRAPALLTQALLPLLKRGPGHIVNVSSDSAFQTTKNRWIYAASKAGLCSLTRSMAAELVGHGIRANTVAPGHTITPMATGRGPEAEEKRRHLERKTDAGGLIPRVARPEEVASVIAFLLSDDASYITATTIHVDGGLVAH